MNQFGFRKNYSTFLALMDLVDNISKNIDEGKYSIGIFRDLSKASDMIDHTIYYWINYVAKVQEASHSIGSNII